MTRPTRIPDTTAARGRRYAPLSGAVVATLLATFVLPSALNVPRSNPTQTLEFAPVPPDIDEPPPDSGNTASLGLGSSSTVPREAIGGEGPGPPPPPTVPEGAGTRPVTKRCVGSPPRQSEDPLAPPCVAHFEGDNGGATYQGVTADEVRIVIYFDGGSGQDDSQLTSRGLEPIPADRIWDLAEPARDDDPLWVREARPYQRYFNQRYQTYDRFVHLFVQYGAAEQTPETRRADVAAAIEQVDPFAMISYAHTFIHDFTAAVTHAGVVQFLGKGTGASAAQGANDQAAAFYRRAPGLVWSYNPSTEQRAEMFVSYACEKVLGHAVSFSGNGDNGQSRRLGIIRAASEERPDLTRYGELIKRGIEDCGGTFVAEGFPDVVACEGCPDTTGYSARDMATFAQEGVTTIIWAGISELNYSNAGAAINYLPEVVIAGSNRIEASLSGQLQNERFWEQVRVVTTYERVDDIDRQPCVRAVEEVDPDHPRFDRNQYACVLYPGLQQLFTAVQVAGPTLTPANIDRGFHAIPRIDSDDPFVPACFYDPGDYTCIKDAQMQWWDADGRTPGSNNEGCYRSMLEGRRFLAGMWPAGDVEAQRSTRDPCNAQGPVVA